MTVRPKSLTLATAALALLGPSAAEAAPECFGREATIVGTPGPDPTSTGRRATT